MKICTHAESCCCTRFLRRFNDRFDLFDGEVVWEFYFDREQHLIGAELHGEQIAHTFDRGIRCEYFPNLIQAIAIGSFAGESAPVSRPSGSATPVSRSAISMEAMGSR